MSLLGLSPSAAHRLTFSGKLLRNTRARFSGGPGGAPSSDERASACRLVVVVVVVVVVKRPAGGARRPESTAAADCDRALIQAFIGADEGKA